MYHLKMKTKFVKVHIMLFCLRLIVQGITIYNDQTIKRDPFTCLKNFDWNRCMLECLYVKMCKSFAYKEEHKICLLYDKSIDDTDFELEVNKTGYGWVDAKDIPAIVGNRDSCSSRPCGPNQRCIPTSPHLCKDVDCGEPPRKGVYSTDSYILPGNETIGSVRSYYCNSARTLDMAYMPWDNPSDCFHRYWINCMSNFQWSHNEPHCRDRSTVFDCKSVRACSAAYGDGEYWIYRTGFFSQRIKVYCHNMNATPAMYLTLNDGASNYAMATDLANQTQTTTFRKVRLESYRYSPYEYGTLKMISDDFTFADSTEASYFGIPRICVNEIVSQFSVNLTGTTFKFSVKNPWSPITTSANFNVNNHTASGSCFDRSELSIEFDKGHGKPLNHNRSCNPFGAKYSLKITDIPPNNPLLVTNGQLIRFSCSCVLIC